jgi:hypothetical protein
VGRVKNARLPAASSTFGEEDVILPAGKERGRLLLWRRRACVCMDGWMCECTYVRILVVHHVPCVVRLDGMGASFRSR